ncbi:hypothetical protein CN275_00300 [Bacillus anthracis]|nr:hypothetical protein CN275_00300 [Bacillus anthracis]
MHWLDFLIGCCAGSLLGIVFCSWLEKRQEREVNREIDKPILGEREIVDGVRYGGLPKGTIVIQKDDLIDKMVEKEMKQLQELMKGKG